MKNMKVVILILKLLITVIVGQTLFFKFSGASESVYIFSRLGIEPWGRIAMGVLELLSIILLWIPVTMLYSLVLILGMMFGAVTSHIGVLGIEIMGDHGELFILALVTLASSATLLVLHRAELRALISKVISTKTHN
jgi:putative oxidoreductase